MRARRLLIATALFGLMGGAPAAFAAPHTYAMAIKDMAFGAPPALKVGDVLVVTNNDIFRHTVTARDKSFDLDLPAGAKGRIVLKKAGSIAFYCRYHPGMTGTLTVGR